MKLLIIGCGSIGERHLRNLRALGIKEIIVSDTDKERLSCTVRKYGIKLSFPDFRRALNERIDAALICTPPDSHLAIALEIIDYGAHVFMEKPISNSLNGIEGLVGKSKKKKLAVMVGYNLRFDSGLRLVKKILSRGQIGNILSARAEFGQYLPYWRPWQDYRKSYTARESCGGGIIFDASHEIDYLRWLLGEVKEVACFSGRVSKLDVDAEDTAEIMLRFKKGTIAGIHLDFVRHDYSRNCELIGEKGTIIWDYPKNYVKVYSAGKKRWQAFNTEGDSNVMYLAEMKHLLNCISGKDEPLIGAEEASKTLKIALAAKKSSALGKRIIL